MSGISLQHIRKSFGAVQVLHGIDLDIRQGEFVVFVGPSGCGKSTMLRIIAGLEEISSGTLKIGEEVMNDVPPGERGIAMVFQSYALYPHMSVYENMAFGLKVSGMAKDEIDRRVRRAADMLQLTAYLDRRPRHLSGGQRQRVAIGRAVTRDPQVFLFDEPLSNLDAALRVATRIEIANLHETMPDTTMIYVTHDQVEAMTLADRIVVFNAGRIEQIGTPMELYDAPQNLFVARFIGSPEMNILPCEVGHDGDSRSLDTTTGAIPVIGRSELASLAGGTQVSVGIRPEHLFPASAGAAKLTGKVVHSEKLGEVTIIHLDIGAESPIAAKLPGVFNAKRGNELQLTFDDANLHFFDRDGTRIAPT
ncbi:ABC transporter ATP-binding protein (plasmid) [Agrobacterium leguminum]|uniref:ABC transporter ATP-binding protein n=1 Tax=Agrobacterium leguminum TaxID=2792015 RepID=UPI00272AF7DA|nr:ABC transporter ATP-binding protein [Agrobacterium leguminum]WLE00625.1 ABC transporter ATP-binding protein [Agrobacterium leguminum]